MDGDKEIGALLLRLSDPHLQRNKDIFVARHVGLHIGLFINQRTQAAGNLQHHVFFTGFVFADRPWILAPVPGIEHDHHRTVAPGFARLRPALGRRNLLLQAPFVVIFQQRQERILLVLPVNRVEIHHQTLFKLGHRSQREEVWRDVLLKFKHHAHGVGIELPHAGRFDKGIAVVDLCPHPLQDRIKIHPFDIHHQPFRVA